MKASYLPLITNYMPREFWQGILKCAAVDWQKRPYFLLIGS